MDRTFTNTAAIIIWCFAVAEIIAFITYACVSIPRLRKRIVSMGRLIPSVQMLVVGGGGVPNYQFTGGAPMPTAPYQQENAPMYPPQPPPPGFHQDQDSSNPPPYASLMPQK